MDRPLIHRLVRRTLPGLWCLVLLLLSSGTASALIVQTSNRVWNGGNVDFGGGTHFLGEPGNAVITFDYSANASGQLVATGRVRGKIFWDTLFGSGCMRAVIRFRNQAGNDLALSTINKCSPGGDANDPANQALVDATFGHSGLYSIQITTGEVRNGALVSPISDTITAPLTRSFVVGVTSGSSRFGNVNFFGVPTGPDSVTFSRDHGAMQGVVNGTLFWLSPTAGCARVVADFRAASSAILATRTRTVCGPNTSTFVNESFVSGMLTSIRLQIGTVILTNFQNITTKTFNFNGDTGDFEGEAEQSTRVHEVLPYTLTWTVPEPFPWRVLKTVDVRIVDGSDVALWLHFQEGNDTVHLVNSANGHAGPAFLLGFEARLQTQYATLLLEEAHVGGIANVVGEAPDSPSVLLKLPLVFKPRAGGRTWSVQVAVTDDLGHDDPFVEVGKITVAK